MATPIVAGNAMLVRDYFMQGFYPTGAKVLTNAFSPSAALVKAVLINGAQPLIAAQNDDAFGTIVPLKEFDNNQGYGRIQLNASLRLASSANSPKTFVQDATAANALAQASSKTFTFKIDTAGCGATDFTMTLVWTDPAGQTTSPACTKCVFNDLDLTAVRSTSAGTTIFANGNNAKDTLNNAEKIRIANPTQGETITATVNARSLGWGTSQKYAFVASGCIASSAPAPAPAPVVTTSAPTPALRATAKPTSAPTKTAPVVAPLVCAKGTYRQSAGSTSCAICPAGKYTAVTGTVGACFDCAAGKALYDTATSASLHDAESDCFVCGSGSYAATAGTTACWACVMGKYLPDQMLIASLHDSESDCITCAAGKYSDKWAVASCTDCAANSYLSDAATNPASHDQATDCFACATGSTSVSGSTTCTVTTPPSNSNGCLAGTYKPSGTNSCSVCSSGKYSAAGATSCTNCAIGKYIYDDALTVASHNEVGDCLTCVAGTFATTAGSKMCTACNPGKFLADPATSPTLHTAESQCTICGAGKYSDKYEAAACLSCPAGTLNSDAGTTTVLHDNVADCLACSVGKYSAGQGSTTCLVCGSGKYSALTKKVSCDACVAGRYLADNAISVVNHDSAGDCLVCPKGKRSSAGSATCV